MDFGVKNVLSHQSGDMNSFQGYDTMRTFVSSIAAMTPLEPSRRYTGRLQQYFRTPQFHERYPSNPGGLEHLNLLALAYVEASV
eukprot:4239685-Amphidinium_carterae.3